MKRQELLRFLLCIRSEECASKPTANSAGLVNVPSTSTQDRYRTPDQIWVTPMSTQQKRFFAPRRQ
ncbi:hypothetical protein SK128_006707 [Halocaridina rubra]|uniref:Uncharacterized protein n=1 Tax=Halocaridina rubra TaxID=373956 RepID=A0AAN8ZSQ3_HALRR